MSTLTIAGSGSTTLAGIITDVTDPNGQFAGLLTGYSGGLTMAGSGTLTLGAANTFRGNTTISTGTLAFRNQNTLQIAPWSQMAGRRTTGITHTVGGLTGTANLLLPTTENLLVGNNNSNTTYQGSLLFQGVAAPSPRSAPERSRSPARTWAVALSTLASCRRAQLVCLAAT